MLDQTASSTAYQRMIVCMPRKHASLLTQLRTGHVPLQKFLHHIQRAESPLCQKCLVKHETVAHFFLRCKAYMEQCNQLQLSLGHNARSVPYLLSQAKALKHIFKFIASTGRSKTTFGQLPKFTMEKRGWKEETRETQAQEVYNTALELPHIINTLTPSGCKASYWKYYLIVLHTLY